MMTDSLFLGRLLLVIICGLGSHLKATRYELLPFLVQGVLSQTVRGQPQYDSGVLGH